MKAGPKKPGSPLALRLIHAIVFLGFAASTLAAVHPELLHLHAALRLPFHPGTPPSPLAVAAGLTAVLGGLWVAMNLLRGRSTSLVVSAALLLGFVGALVFRAAEPPVKRTWQGADVALLEVTKALHLKMVERLQRDAEVPRDPKAWQEALDGAAHAASPGGASAIHGRTFRALPYRLAKAPGQGKVPEGLDPATVVLWTSDDGVGFELTPVGLTSSGGVGPLTDDRGTRVVFKGVYNPDLPRPPGNPAAGP
ncbi:MAG: hypothetical protein ACYC8T_34675 [Myxococcaceae bacterium]